MTKPSDELRSSVHVPRTKPECWTTPGAISLSIRFAAPTFGLNDHPVARYNAGMVRRRVTFKGPPRRIPTVDELFDCPIDDDVNVGDGPAFDWDPTDPSQVALVSTPEGMERSKRLAEEGRRSFAYHRARAAWFEYLDEDRAGGVSPAVRRREVGDGADIIPLRPGGHGDHPGGGLPEE